MSTIQDYTKPERAAPPGVASMTFRTPEQIAAGVQADQPQALDATRPTDTHQPAAQASPVKKARAKAKKARAETKPRAHPLSMKHRFEVMSVINLAPSDEPDVELATRINAGIVDLPRPVTPAMVRAYRVELGLPPVKQPSAAVLRARVLELERLLAESKQGQIQLTPGREGDGVVITGSPDAQRQAEAGVVQELVGGQP